MVKGNQGNLHKAIIAYFNGGIENSFDGITYNYYETIEKNHGRLITIYETLSYAENVESHIVILLISS